MKKLIVLLIPVIFILSFISVGFAEGASNYVLIFQCTEYNSKITDTVEYFFKSVLKPGDNLMIFTPLYKPYAYAKSLKTQTTDQLIKQTSDILKRDINFEASNYEAVMENLARIITDKASSLKAMMLQYRQLFDTYLKQRSRLGDSIFLGLADMFKNLKGNNYIFLFYQKELRFIPDKTLMDTLRSNMDNQFMATETFLGDNTEKLMDTDKIIPTLKDAGVIVNFVYLHREINKRMGLDIREFSGDYFNVLSKIATDTGGFVLSTNKPVESFKQKK